MTYWEVFNGDADGLCAMVQIYRDAPRMDSDPVKVVTGRKRDIALLSRVHPAAGDQVTVLDVSMRSNADDLSRILKSGANVFYCDHHQAGNIPDHPALTTVIDTSPEMCTAALVDMCLGGKYRAWAVTACFGDNFPKLARRLASGHDFPLETLERFGILLNYNGYGASVEDLHFDPAELYAHLRDFDTPMEFLSQKGDIFQRLDQGYESDMAGASGSKVIDETARGLVLEMQDSAASRRVSGVYGNALAQEFPDRAHAILTQKPGGYVVSVRAPLSSRRGADTLCSAFETGGGRAAAAGINHLPDSDLTRFVTAFRAAFPE